MNLTTAARELFGIEVEIPVGTIFSSFADYDLASNKKVKSNHSRQYDEEKSTSTVTLLASERSRETKVEGKSKPVTLSVSEKPHQDAVSTASQSTNSNRILSEDFNDESEEEEEEGEIKEERERGENDEEKISERGNEKRKEAVNNGSSKKRAREGKAKSKTKKGAAKKAASESKNGASLSPREGEEEDVNVSNHNSNGSNSGGEEDFLVPNARKPSAAAHPKNKKAVPHVFVIGPNFKRRVFEYKCKICGLKCVGSHMLANHMGRVHPKKNKK